MKLDHEGQRAQLLQIIDGATFTGASVDAVFILKSAIRQATVERPIAATGEHVDDRRPAAHMAAAPIRRAAKKS